MISDTHQIAKILTEALPYIRKFSGSVLVIKLGGATMKNTKLLDTFARDLVLLKLVGINPVVVHGGGPQIDNLLRKLNIEPRFVDGMRVTDEQTMEVVQMVLAGQINPSIVDQINRNGGNSIGMTGKDGSLIKARKLQPQLAASGESVDFGQVGEIIRVKVSTLRTMLAGEFIPVIAPIGYSDDGTSYNINADLVASEIAAAIQAEKLILLTNTQGVIGADGKFIDALSGQQANELIKKGVIQGGMVPKVRCALEAVNKNIHQAHIVDGRVHHALLLEILTDQGIGTLISQ